MTSAQRFMLLFTYFVFSPVFHPVCIYIHSAFPLRGSLHPTCVTPNLFTTQFTPYCGEPYSRWPLHDSEGFCFNLYHIEARPRWRFKRRFSEPTSSRPVSETSNGKTVLNKFHRKLRPLLQAIMTHILTNTFTEHGNSAKHDLVLVYVGKIL